MGARAWLLCDIDRQYTDWLSRELSGMEESSDGSIMLHLVYDLQGIQEVPRAYIYMCTSWACALSSLHMITDWPLVSPMDRSLFLSEEGFKVLYGFKLDLGCVASN